MNKSDQQSPTASKDGVRRENCIFAASRSWPFKHIDPFADLLAGLGSGQFKYSGLSGCHGSDQKGPSRVEMGPPKILVFLADSSRQPAPDFQSLQPANVGYRVYSDTNITETNPIAVLAACPIHGHVLLCDGSVEWRRKARR